MNTYKYAFTMIVFFVVFISEVSAGPSPAFEGRKLYLSHCMICHGFDGKGGGPLAQKMDIEPEDLTVYTASHSDNYLHRIIAGTDRDSIARRSGHGEISELMPKWSSVFDASEVRALIAYLRYLSTSKHKLTGDPELGSELYQKYCSICHGTNGDGNGALSTLIGIKPIDHTNPLKTDKLNNDSLAASILNGEGKYMPAWKGILSESDVNSLVSYIRLLYQVWGKLDHGGYVIVLPIPTLDSNQTKTRELLTDTSCSSPENLSTAGKSRAIKTHEIFKSRGVLIKKVVASTHCLASETAKLAFGQFEAAEYLTTDTGQTEKQREENIAKLESLIGSYRGKDNLLVLTHPKIIEELSFEKVDNDQFLVLMPLGDGQYEEIGVYKLNY